MRTTTRLAVGVLALVGILVTRPPAAGRVKWDPVDPRELALTTPQVEKDADAEVLLWDVWVTDKRTGDFYQTVWDHYLRIKIYTDRGRDAQSRVDIPLGKSARVRGVEGRSVKRDGSSVELKGADVFERDLVKAGGFKIHATSFVLPAVETGGIVEYRWREFHDDEMSHNLRLPFSRDIPVKLVRYHISPLDLGGTVYAMAGMPFHASPTPLKREDNALGVFFMTSLADVPAFHDEPRAPSEWETRPWFFLYYKDRTAPTEPSAFWRALSRNLASDDRKATAPTSEIKQAAAALNVGSAPIDAKIDAVLRFCRTKIKRMDVDTVSDAERRGFTPNKSATEALAKGRGTAGDVSDLFISMLRALGLDARTALLASRDDVAFNPAMELPQLMRERVVAFKDGASWRYLDPTNVYAPSGHLASTQELATVLVPDDRDLVGGTTPAAPPEWSTRTRTATMRLSEDGTLEGDAVAEYAGHLDTILKEQDDHLAASEREKSLKDLVVERLPGAEVSQVSVENVTEVGKPYTNRFHLKVPGYAQRTGSRLFVQPAVFQKGIAAVFPASERRYPIFFDHAWCEADRVTIALPEGYELESPDAPSPIPLGKIGAYTMKVARSADGRTVTMTREFSFGRDQMLQFPATGYAPLKAFFDAVARADGHTLTLRRATAGGATK